MERLAAEYLTLATLTQPSAGMPYWPARACQRRTSMPFGRAGRTGRSLPRCAMPKPAASTSKAPSPSWWPFGPATTPRTSPPCCTDGWSAGTGGQEPTAGDGQLHRRTHSAGRKRHQPRPGPGAGRSSQGDGTTCQDPDQQATEDRQAWVRWLGTSAGRPRAPRRLAREVSVVAAYRDRWHITSRRTLGAAPTPPTLSNGSNASERWLRPGGRLPPVRKRPFKTGQLSRHMSRSKHETKSNYERRSRRLFCA